MGLLKRVLRALPLLLLSPFLLAISALVLAITDLLSRVGKAVTTSKSVDTGSASVVIPNWNGRDLLEKYLPSIVTALAGNPDNEIVVVDNGSEDGSADFVRQRFPQVKLVALQGKPGLRRRVERRLPRGQERHRGPAE